MGLVGSGRGHISEGISEFPHFTKLERQTHPQPYPSIIDQHDQLLEKNDGIYGILFRSYKNCLLYMQSTNGLSNLKRPDFLSGEDVICCQSTHLEPSFSTLFHQRMRSNRIVQSINIATKNRCRDERSRDNTNCHRGCSWCCR